MELKEAIGGEGHMAAGLTRRAVARNRRLALAGVAALALSAGSGSEAQQRAQPVTGPGVVTIGNIPANARVYVRSGPASVFPSVTTIGYGTRVRVGSCQTLGDGRWCQIDSVDGKASGFVNAGFLVEGGPASGGSDDLSGGPDYWAVRGLPRGETLNVRRDPSAKSPALATLSEGEVVRNLGCRMSGSTRWCNIRSITGMDVTGWVSARFLQEAAAPKPGSGTGGEAFVVTGLPAGDALNVRSRPGADSRILATLRQGERVERFECEKLGKDRWCKIRSTGGVTVTGWVNNAYLKRR
jgi:uncharacterized protein YgiM (DUF1202 family)